MFHTRSGDFFVSAANNRQFAALTKILGRPELATDPRFTDNAGRITHVDDLAALLSGLIGTWDGTDLAAQLIAAGVPASPVNDIGTALASPQVAHRGLITDSGGYRGTGVPVRFGRSATRPPTPPLPRGASTSDVLAALGYDQEEIGRLAAAGAFGPAPHPAVYTHRSMSQIGK